MRLRTALRPVKEIMSAPMPLDRTRLRKAYRMEENACVEDRLRQAESIHAKHAQSSELAIALVEDARSRDVGGIDAFLHTYGLATEEGIALMCLAEALLRVPDGATADALIRAARGALT